MLWQKSELTVHELAQLNVGINRKEDGVRQRVNFDKIVLYERNRLEGRLMRQQVTLKSGKICSMTH